MPKKVFLVFFSVDMQLYKSKNVKANFILQNIVMVNHIYTPQHLFKQKKGKTQGKTFVNRQTPSLNHH